LQQKIMDFLGEIASVVILSKRSASKDLRTDDLHTIS